MIDNGMEISDEVLVEGCVRRDEKMRNALYNKYARNIYAWILRYAQNEEDAKDILQETFIVVFSKIAQYEGKGSLVAWMTTIAIRQTLTFYRKKKRQSPYTDLAAEWYKEEQVEDESVQWPDELSYKVLLELIRQLPDNYRMVFNLCEIDEHSIKEVSEWMGCSAENCRVMLFRAKKWLRKKINDLYQKQLL